jgi:hypothetical protein
MCHPIWLLSRKYGTVWYHPASSKLWYLTALSFVNFQEKLTGTSCYSLRVWSQLCSACCVFGAGCTFCVNTCTYQYEHLSILSWPSEILEVPLSIIHSIPRMSIGDLYSLPISYSLWRWFQEIYTTYLMSGIRSECHILTYPLTHFHPCAKESGLIVRNLIFANQFK